jgi:hypothetical protein
MKKGAIATVRRIQNPPTERAWKQTRREIAKRPPKPLGPRASEAAQFEQGLAAWGEMLLSGGVDLYVNRQDMSYLTEAVLPELKVTALGRTLRNAEPIEVGFNGDLVTVKSLTLGTQERFVRVQGGVALEEGEEPVLDMRLSGTLDMALLNLMPSVYTDLRGLTAVNLSVRGPTSAPVPSGTIRFSPPGAEAVAFRLRGLEQDVVLEGGTVVVCSADRGGGDPVISALCRGQPAESIVIPPSAPLEVSLLDGRATVSGSVGFANLKPGAVDLKAYARNMNFQVPGVVNISFHVPELRLELGDLGDPATWMLNAELDIFDGRYYQELNILQGVLSGLTSGQAEQATFSVLERVPLLRKPGFNLKITGRDGFVVKSSIDTVALDLELKTALSVKKRLGVELDDQLKNVTVEGNVEVLSGGKITYQGGDFIIRKGDITWEGDLFDPRLDLVAETEVQNSCGQLQARAEGTETDDLGSTTSQQTYSIAMTVKGRLGERRLLVELTSTPFASQADILTLILVGCTADQLTASAAGAPALELALRPLLNKVESELNRYFAVDELALESNLDRTELRLSERLTNRFIVRLSGAFGSEGAEQSAGFQYFLYDNFFIDIAERSGEQDAVKLDLEFRLRVPLPE